MSDTRPCPGRSFSYRGRPKLAARAQRARLWLPERRAHHYLDIARGYTQIGNIDKASEMLLEGDRLAPSEIRCRPLAHEVLSDVLRRTRGTPPAPIAELAEQMGVGV